MYAKAHSLMAAAAAVLLQLAVVGGEKQSIEYTFTPGSDFECRAGALNRTCAFPFVPAYGPVPR